MGRVGLARGPPGQRRAPPGDVGVVQGRQLSQGAAMVRGSLCPPTGL